MEQTLRASALERRPLLVAAAVTVVAFVLVDVLLLGVHSTAIYLARAVQAAAFLAVAYVLPLLRRTATRRALLLGAALTAVTGMAIIVRETGGPDSPYLFVMYLLPMLVAGLFPEDLWSLGASCLANCAAGALLLWPLGLRRVGLWALVSLGTGFFAFLISALENRLRRRERVLLLERATSTQKLQESEERRARSERLAIVGQLAAGVAHELNNPLAFVKANVNFLVEALERAEDGKLDRDDVADALEAARDAVGGVDRLQLIVADLRTFAREPGGPTGSCDVAAVVETALRISSVRVKGMAEVKREVALDLPLVAGHAGRLIQVLVNLVVNAADALEEARRRDGCIRVAAAPSADGVCITVEDDGPGLPAAALQRLFSPFFTTKPPGKGTGLGLALAREYVEAAGGTIDAANRAEGGARFSVFLPAGHGAVAA
jgi:C4-dicarboxylate-specific signal transduction histidine kinase